MSIAAEYVNRFYVIVNGEGIVRVSFQERLEAVDLTAQLSP